MQILKKKQFLLISIIVLFVFSLLGCNKTVNFYDDNQLYLEKTIPNKSILDLPANPRKTGYTFRYWSVQPNGNKYYPSSPVTKDINLYAIWDINEYSVIFKDGNNILEKKITKYYSLLDFPDIPKKEGHSFKYWSLTENGNRYDSNTLITRDIVLYAKWEVNEYFVYLKDGYNTLERKPVRFNSTFDIPDIPKKAGYTFKYWSETENGDPYNFTAPATTNLALYAIWDTNEYNVIFKVDSKKFFQEKIKYKGSLNIPDSPKKEGHSFKYWSEAENGSQYDYTKPTTSDTVLYAIWDINEYIVTFKDGSNILLQERFKHMEPLRIPDNTTKVGHTLKHWSLIQDGEQYDYTTPITTGLSLYAIWDLNEYTVTFKDKNGIIKELSVKHFDNISEPEEPSKDNYFFQYWKDDSSNQPYNFETPIESDINLKAVWTIDKKSTLYKAQIGGIAFITLTIIGLFSFLVRKLQKKRKAQKLLNHKKLEEEENERRQKEKKDNELKGKQYKIKNDDKGYTYESIMNPYLTDVKVVEIEDPFIREPFQIQYFVRFCELLVKRPSLKKIILITSQGKKEKPNSSMMTEAEKQKMEENLDLLKRSLLEYDVDLEVKYNEDFHDREIRIDNNWCITMGCGLVFYQIPGSWFDIGSQDLSLRKCKATKITISKIKNFRFELNT